MAKIAGGYIILARKILDSPSWKALNDSGKVVMITLLTLANHKPNKWYNKILKKEILIERGQLVTSRHELAKKAGVSERSVRTALSILEGKHLVERPTPPFSMQPIDNKEDISKISKNNSQKTTSFLTNETTNLFSIITICKYDSYQNSKNYTDQVFDQPIDQAPTKHRPQTRMIINDNKDTTIGVLPVPTTQIASLLLKTSFLDQLKNVYPELNLEAEIKSCVAWHSTHSKPNGNWERRIQNWLRIAFEKKGVVGMVKQEESSLERYKRLQETT